jgi:uncharacterized RDD family membrane protein YckC
MAPSDPSAAPPPPPPVWASGPGGPPAIRYGGFWIRVVAYLIDAIVLNIVLWLLTVITGLRLISYTTTDHLEPLPILAPLVVNWLYFALMESSERGATLGKMAVGLRVVTGAGQRLSFANATGRYFAKFISALILGIGFIMVAFTERKRGLHDMIANTLVVKVP